MTQATRVLAIRHGETAWNADGRIQGQIDIPLNDTGRWQASRLKAAVAHEGLSAVYASDLQRAFDTAGPVAEAAGVAVVPEPALRERAFGSFEGHTFHEIEARWPDLAVRWRRREPDFGPEGGEVLAAFYDRVVTTATRLAAAHPGETIALVAHGGVLDCLYRAAARVALDAPRTWQIGNAGINRLLYTDAGLSLIGWGDTQHLDHGPRDEFNDAATPDEPAARGA